MDVAEPGTDHFSVSLGQLVAEVLTAKGLNKAWLARKLNVHPAQITRLLHGRTRAYVQLICDLEDALELPRGHFFRALGVVPEAESAAEAIELDPALAFDPSGRDTLRDLYESIVKRSRRDGDQS